MNIHIQNDIQDEGADLKKKVILAVKPPLFCEALRSCLEETGVEVVGEATDPLELLLAIRERRPDIVLHTTDTVGEIPSFYSHIFYEFPEVIVIALQPDQDRGYVFRQVVVSRHFRASKVDDLLSIIRPALLAG